MEPLYQNMFGKVQGYNHWKGQGIETNTHRMGITFDQKYIWNIQIDNSFQLLRDNNKGTLISGCTFIKVFEYFPLWGDDTC